MGLTLGEQAEMALRIVAECKTPIAYDTETTGLDRHKNQPVGYVITESAVDNLYIPVRHGGGGNLMDPRCGPMTAPDSPTVQHQFERDLAKAFEARRAAGYLTIGHNVLFDMHMSANQGIILGRNCEDTGINEALLNEYSFGYSLDQCAKNHEVTPKQGQMVYDHLATQFGGVADKKIMEHFWRLAGNDPIGTDYAMGDGITTLEVWAAQQKRIEEDCLLRIHPVESQLIYTIFRMERRGIRIDQDRMAGVFAEVAKLVEEARAALPDGFNPRSNPQMRKLCEEAGVTNWPMTDPSKTFPNGQPSFTEHFLKTFDRGRDVLKLRKWTNLENTFLRPLRDEHMVNGRVYTHLNQLKGDEYGTITGRFSCSQPNLQQVPKRDKEVAKLFRSIFAADPGYEFYEADYSQCEPRLFAHYTAFAGLDNTLLEGYKAGMDAHDMVAKLINVERDPTAKRMNMGLFTGMQVDSFEGHMNWQGETVDVPIMTPGGEEVVPVRKAQHFFDLWHGAFPGIKAFQNDCKKKFKDRGWVRTLLGRLCRLGNPRFAYQGTSRIIQGGNADIIKYKLLEIDKWLEANYDGQCQLLLTVHDSINFQSEDSEKGRQIARELVAMMEDVQSPPFNLICPFKVDAGRGKTWAEATFGGKGLL